MGHYEVLGVEPAASMEEIRRSYLRLARTAHPDFHQRTADERERAEARMRELNAAWAVLSDVDERSAYDRERLRNASTGPRSSIPGAAAHDAWQPFDAGPVSGFDDRDDRPITSSRVPRWLTMIPVALAGAGLAAVVVGSVVGLVAIVDLGVFALVFSALLFILAPIFAVAASSREDRGA